MKYKKANKYVTVNKRTGLIGDPVSADIMIAHMQAIGVNASNLEVYELVPAKLIPAQAAKIVRA